ncbi:MAG: ATP-dependent zinc metalloprotease FtsH [Phycisphaeraceae bacterium]|nr:MAG: ATP-dependent zinc metalloprotease FtsH [Phycisphaeraceae bacterium]
MNTTQHTQHDAPGTTLRHEDGPAGDPEGQRPTGPGRKGPEGEGRPGPGGPPRSFFGFMIIITLAILLVMMLSSVGAGKQITYNEFENYWNEKQIVPESVKLSDTAITATLKQDDVSESTMTVRVPVNQASREYYAAQLNELTDGRVTNKPTSAWMNILFFFGPFVLIIVVLWFMISRSMRAAGGGGGMLGSFGKSRHKTLTKEMTGITFKDVAGIDEAKTEVTEIIEFLKNPKKFTRLGGRIPRGVLLMGEPGCGKTLLAKAIAGEADVPFFSISGSDFVEMFVGVGASRVRDLFKQAKDNAPCIIFLDEIDAVGRRRGGGYSQGGHDEREQTLNAILVEMDGFGSGDGVIVIAATNRGDVLDPALVRPGRFDRQIAVPLPDVKGRLDILKVHAKKVKLGPDVDMEKVARGTPMFSGADLAAIINEAAISATMLNKDFIEHEDLEEARDKVKFGRANKSRTREADENKLVAYHEAGHAVLQALLPDSDPLHKVTIIPRGSAGGATFSLPEKDRMGYSLKWLLATLKVMCGGRIAEAKAMDDVSSGASQDIMQATQLSRMMILDWGMSDRLGFIKYSGVDTREFSLGEREYSEETARVIDQEIRRLVDEAYAAATQLLAENWHKVDAVAQALLKYETLTADEVHKLMRGESLGKPTVADLLAADKPAKKFAPATPSGDAEPDLPGGAAPSPA